MNIHSLIFCTTYNKYVFFIRDVMTYPLIILRARVFYFVLSSPPPTAGRDFEKIKKTSKSEKTTPKIKNHPENENPFWIFWRGSPPQAKIFEDLGT